MKTIQLANESFFPKVCELINQGKSVSINLKGNSMRPFLESGRDVGILAKPHGFKKGDVVLAEILKGHYVLHRIDKVRIDGKDIVGLCKSSNCEIILRGDGNSKGTESCTGGDVRAICTHVVRNGRKIDLNTSICWKLYSWIWTRTLPVRRYLLAIYKLLWRRELPQKWKKNID